MKRCFMKGSIFFPYYTTRKQVLSDEISVPVYLVVIEGFIFSDEKLVI